MRKLKYTEIKPTRLRMLKEQDYKCALCGEPIDENDAALDHEHSNGKIRSVLHRGCNILLGKIQNSLTINRISKDRLRIILDNTWTYIYEHPAKDEELVHPTYKEPKQKSTNRGNKTNDTNVSSSSTKNTSK
jgi:hypothetical protein